MLNMSADVIARYTAKANSAQHRREAHKQLHNNSPITAEDKLSFISEKNHLSNPSGWEYWLLEADISRAARQLGVGVRHYLL